MKIPAIFKAPTFEGDEEKNIEATTLNAAIWTVIGLLLFSLIGNFLDPNTHKLTIASNFIFLLITLGTLYRIRRGWIKRTSIILLILGTTHIAIATILFGSIRSISTFAFIIIIAMAGFQFRKIGLISAILSVAAIILALINAENNHLLPAPDFSVGIPQWITLIALFGLTGNFIFVAVKIIRQFLERSQQEIELRKITEEKLHVFSLAIKQSPASIMITDPDGNIEEVNPKFLELTSYSKEEVVGKNPRILKSGQHPPEFYKELWSTITAGNVWKGEIQNKKKNGEFYWEKASIAPIVDKNNRITHFIGIKEDITELKSLQDKLKFQALHDPLTGLNNRYYMNEALEREFARAERSETPISIILLDLDHLKELNDLGGHALGDHALRKLAEHLCSSVRDGDVVCRYGGDEFAIILPNTSAEKAFARATQLQQRMEALPLIDHKNQALQVTFTAGVASYPTHGNTSEEIFNYADVALYRAKLKGRNCVERYSPED